MPIADHSLIVSTGTRNWIGAIPAGYQLNGQILSRIEPLPFLQQYFIDKNIELNKVNPNDRIIFNPAEVHVTANDLHFPANYTFKTISGRYPYLPEVLNQNTVENGGPYNTVDPFDPNYISNHNTETDLYKDFHVSSAYSATDHKLASIYHLDNGSKTTIEPCVRIFDATFEVNGGSELVFQNWSTNQINVFRYQLLFLGGKVTKCDNEFLFQNYLENKKIQCWNAGDYIKAGANVNANAPNGIYKLLTGSESYFHANNFVSLEEGFDSESGAFLDALIEPISIPSCPPMRLAKKGNPVALSSSEDVALAYFECVPNPVQSHSVFMFKIGRLSKVKLEIYNGLGQLVEIICDEKELPAGSFTYNIKNLDFISGIYYAKLQVNEDSRSLKFIKQ